MKIRATSNYSLSLTFHYNLLHITDEVSFNVTVYACDNDCRKEFGGKENKNTRNLVSDIYEQTNNNLPVNISYKVIYC